MDYTDFELLLNNTISCSAEADQRATVDWLPKLRWSLFLFCVKDSL